MGHIRAERGVAAAARCWAKDHWSKLQGGCSTKDKAGAWQDKTGGWEHGKTWTCPKYEQTIDKCPEYVFYMSQTIWYECSNLGVPLLDKFDPESIHIYDPKQHKIENLHFLCIFRPGFDPYSWTRSWNHWQCLVRLENHGKAARPVDKDQKKHFLTLDMSQNSRNRFQK